MVFALDAMTTGVLAAKRAVITLSGAPKISRKFVNEVNLKASPGRSIETAMKTKTREPVSVSNVLEDPLP